MNQQVTMALDVAGIGWVEMDRVRIESQCAISEEEGGVWNQTVGEGRAVLCCYLSVSIALHQWFNGDFYLSTSFLVLRRYLAASVPQVLLESAPA
jgi:hypothetical protein